MEEDTDLILFCDFETTGKNPYSDEIIEGYFELHQDGELVDNYHFQSQTINWSHEAFLVHGITFEEMKTYLEVMRLGAFGFLKKPLDIKALKEKVAEAFS